MITRAEAVEMFQSDDLIALGMEADAVRKKLHPELIVSYSVEAAVEPSSAAIAGLSFGMGNTVEQWVNELEAIWHTQAESGVFAAVTPAFTGTAVEYLRTLAICRIYFENIPHVQSSPQIAGSKVCQIALRFGANDLGDLSAGITEEELRRLIREAGFIPKQRDALFRSLSLN